MVAIATCCFFTAPLRGGICARAAAWFTRRGPVGSNSMTARCNSAGIVGELSRGLYRSRGCTRCSRPRSSLLTGCSSTLSNFLSVNDA